MEEAGSGIQVGVLWRGEPGGDVAGSGRTRLYRILEDIEGRGAAAVPVVFSEEKVEAVRERMLGLDGVLVWVDPVMGDRDRGVLDGLLREVAREGVWVSAHPDVILKMGTKDVLVRTREMEWGSDTRRVDSPEGLAADLLPRLRAGPRVLKQYRGNGGNGTWRVELLREAGEPEAALVRAQHALRDTLVEDVLLGEFIERCGEYFEAGPMVEQPYQDRLGEGMVRCYLAGNRVAGFGHQMVTALLPPPPGTRETLLPPPREYFGPGQPEFRRLRALMESRWVKEMRRLCEVSDDELPAIWDADFLLGPKNPSGEDSYVLCEINISSVFPIPEEAPPVIAEAAIARAREARARRAAKRA